MKANLEKKYKELISQGKILQPQVKDLPPKDPIMLYFNALSEVYQLCTKSREKNWSLVRSKLGKGLTIESPLIKKMVAIVKDNKLGEINQHPDLEDHILYNPNPSLFKEKPSKEKAGNYGNLKPNSRILLGLKKEQITPKRLQQL